MTITRFRSTTLDYSSGPIMQITKESGFGPFTLRPKRRSVAVLRLRAGRAGRGGAVGHGESVVVAVNVGRDRDDLPLLDQHPAHGVGQWSDRVGRNRVEIGGGRNPAWWIRRARLSERMVLTLVVRYRRPTSATSQTGCRTVIEDM